MNAGNDLAELMRGLAAYRLDHPTDDLTSALVNGNVDGESLTDAELASFFILLVVAGNETTRNAISHALWAFTEHPDQRALWAADFDAVAPTAVDEIVRWATPVIFMRRTVTEETTLSGHDLRRGRQVHPLLQLGQPRRGRLRQPPALRRAAPPQPPRRLRGARPPLLPGRPPGPARDHGHVPRALPPPPRHPRHRPSPTGCGRTSSTASSTCPAPTDRATAATTTEVTGHTRRTARRWLRATSDAQPQGQMGHGVNQRAQIKMTPEEIDGFLHERPAGVAVLDQPRRLDPRRGHVVRVPRRDARLRDQGQVAEGAEPAARSHA